MQGQGRVLRQSRGQGRVQGRVQNPAFITVSALSRREATALGKRRARRSRVRHGRAFTITSGVGADIHLASERGREKQNPSNRRHGVPSVHALRSRCKRALLTTTWEEALWQPVGDVGGCLAGLVEPDVRWWLWLAGLAMLRVLPIQTMAQVVATVINVCPALWVRTLQGMDELTADIWTHRQVGLQPPGAERVANVLCVAPGWRPRIRDTV